MPAASEQLNVDLRQMVQDSKVIVKHRAVGISTQPPDIRINEELLMTKLASYITRRQHNAFNEGYQKGKSNARDQI